MPCERDSHGRRRPRARERTDLARARQAYELAATTRMAWREIASELGYSQAHQGRAALMMARRYAARSGARAHWRATGVAVTRGFRTWFGFGWWIAIAVILAGLGAATWKTTSDYTGHDWHVFGVYALSEFMLVVDFKPDKTKKIRDFDGTVLVMTLDTIAHHPMILDLRERMLEDAFDAALLGGGACAGLAVAALFGLRLLGRRLGRGRRLRGGELATAGELKRRTLPLWRGRPLRRPEAAPYTVAGIPWPKGAERLHTIVSGTTGSGKTVLISDLVEQIRARGERCVIYDKMGSCTETEDDGTGHAAPDIGLHVAMRWQLWE